MRSSVIRTLALACFLPVPGAAQTFADLPVTRAGDAMFVTVTINGSGPYRLILDTGTSAIALDTQIADSLQLPRVGERVERMPHGQLLTIAVHALDSLGAGPLQLRDARVDVLDLPPGMHGILGLPAFENLLLAIDAVAGTAAIAFDSLSADDPHVRSAVRSEDILALQGDVAGTPLLFHLDSGNPGDIMIPRSIADRIPFVGTLEEIGVAVTLGGRSRLFRGQLDGTLTIGPLRVENPTLDVMERAAYGTGNLGLGFFEKYRVTIDATRARIRIEPR